MRRLVARIIFMVLFIYVVTSGFNHVLYAYSLPADNYVVEWDTTFNITDNEPDEFDVAETNWNCRKFDKTAHLSIQNAYPYYETTVITNIKNTGSMPIKLEAVNINGEEDNLKEYLGISFGATDGTLLVNRVIKANEAVEVKLDIKVTENVEQSQEYTFNIPIVVIAVQATEENGSGGNNEGGGGEPGGPSGPGEGSGGGDSGTGDSGSNQEDNASGSIVEENIIEQLEVKPELPETMLSIEEDILPESPQVSINPELTSLPIKYNELPYTGGSPYALVGGILTMTGMGILLRKKII